MQCYSRANVNSYQLAYECAELKPDIFAQCSTLQLANSRANVNSNQLAYECAELEPDIVAQCSTLELADLIAQLESNGRPIKRSYKAADESSDLSCL